MCRTDHQNKTHNRRRDFVNVVGEKLRTSYLFDGESCLTATTANLLNVMVIAPITSNYSDAYKVGMGIEKQVNTIGDLQNTWLQDGKSQWHGQVRDFWGPILANLHTGGGWLSISEEIFNTGAEHRFYPKEVLEENSWKRYKHLESRGDDEPALVLMKQVSRAYQGGDFGDFTVHQLFDVNKIQELIERQRLAEERDQEDRAQQDRESDAVLDADEPPEPVPVALEVTDWDKDLADTCSHFSGCLAKFGLNQRVAIESLVHHRRAQWTQMTKEQRDVYTAWKTQRYAKAQPDRIRVRDLIMSPDCLYLPPSHYVCPICWLNQTVYKKTTANGMRQHCFKAHSIQAKSCYGPFTLALGKMIGHDVMLEAEWPNPDGRTAPMSRIVRGKLSAVLSSWLQSQDGERSWDAGAP
jgi:hypothetical protein